MSKEDSLSKIFEVCSQGTYENNLDLAAGAFKFRFMHFAI